jgi:hypothetical protein
MNDIWLPRTRRVPSVVGWLPATGPLVIAAGDSAEACEEYPLPFLDPFVRTQKPSQNSFAESDKGCTVYLLYTKLYIFSFPFFLKKLCDR